MFPQKSQPETSSVVNRRRRQRNKKVQRHPQRIGACPASECLLPQQAARKCQRNVLSKQDASLRQIQRPGNPAAHADRPGQIVSIDDLLTRVSPDSVYQAIASLRRQLGDDPRQPTYIATIPRLGYQMVSQVSALSYPANDAALDPLSTQPSRLTLVPSARRKAVVPAAIAAALCLVLLAGSLIHSSAANKNRAALSAIPVQTQKSIAVLPFLDLTQGMKEEEFADGMTEELIDKLAKVPGLHVPSPKSSFVYKRKQVPIADIARALLVSPT